MPEESATRDAETIAALLDGRLSDKERDELIQRLDRDADLYEIFVEAARCKEALSLEEQADSTSRRWTLDLWSWVAAAAFVVALAPAIYTTYLHRGEPTNARLAEYLVTQEGLGAGWSEAVWSTPRALPTLEPSTAALRYGARSLDLQVALRADQREEAKRLAKAIVVLLDGIDIGSGATLYKELQGLLERKRSTSELLEKAAEAELQTFLLVEHEQRFRLGRWAEAGRLAARHGQLSLLRSRSFRRTGNELASLGWEDGIAETIDEIPNRLDTRRQALDLAAIEQAFTDLLEEI